MWMDAFATGGGGRARVGNKLVVERIGVQGFFFIINPVAVALCKINHVW